jgi:hypothetical protein
VRAADFGGAGQKRQHRTGIGAQRGRDRIRHLPLDRRIRLAAEIARFHRKGAAFAGNDGRIAKEFADPCTVKRRRHHEDTQILAQASLRIARQREPEIGIKRTLVKLVKQHGGDIR